MSSLVESEHPVGEAAPESDNTINTPEATVLFVSPTDDGLMSTIAEGSISTHLAVAEFVIARLRNVESDRSATGNDPLALTITQG